MAQKRRMLLILCGNTVLSPPYPTVKKNTSVCHFLGAASWLHSLGFHVTSLTMFRFFFSIGTKFLGVLDELSPSCLAWLL